MLIEGVQYTIDWKKFKKGTHIFIPCNNPKKAMKIIRPILKRLHIRVDTKIAIVEGVRGLQIWRV
jgi:hypothetical protein